MNEDRLIDLIQMCRVFGLSSIILSRWIITTNTTTSWPGSSWRWSDDRSSRGYRSWSWSYMRNSLSNDILNDVLQRDHLIEIRLLLKSFGCLVTITFDLCPDDAQRQCRLTSKEGSVIICPTIWSSNASRESWDNTCKSSKRLWDYESIRLLMPW